MTKGDFGRLGCAVFAATIGLAVTGMAHAGSTVRIEDGYPSAVTISREAGVLVFRALPPTERVIVNPGGKTPISLSITEKQVIEQKDIYNYRIRERR